MSITINLRPQKPTINISSKKIYPNTDGVKLENFIKEVREEVKNLPKKQKKKMKKQLVATLAGLYLTLKGSKAFAMTATGTSGLISPELMRLMFMLVVLSVVIGVCLAMICGVIAGIAKMLNQKEYSEAWTENIVKGFGQVIMFPTIIASILFLTHMLFGGSGYYIDIWKEVEVFMRLE
jgi:nitrogen fixation/metabolism regulation signal transduction histidine kinase